MNSNIIFFRFCFAAIFALGVISAAAQTPQELDDWRLVSHSFLRINDYPVAQKEITVTLDIKGSEITGFSGCNRFTGQFKFEENGRLAVGPFSGTLRACGPVDDRFERQFRETLEGADYFSFENGILTIRDNQTQFFLRFERVRKPEILLWYVNKTAADCVGAVKTKCLQVKDSKTGEWQNFFGPIEGFTFKKGRYYIIEVERTRRENAPADAAPYSLRLIRIVKTVKKEKDL